MKISEIHDGSNFWVNIPSAASAPAMFAAQQKLDDIERLLKKYESTEAPVAEVSGGAVVGCAHDDGDGLVWMRAKVEEVYGDEAKVFFLDYGHR